MEFNVQAALCKIYLNFIHLFREYRSNQEIPVRIDSVSRGTPQSEGVYDNPSLTYERGSEDRNGEYEIPLATISSKRTVYEVIHAEDNTQTENVIELRSESLLDAL